MPALNFQAKFAPLVESGEKRQTIRKLRKDGRDPKPGDRLYLYTGMRTKACRKLGEVKCKKVYPIKLYVRSRYGPLGRVVSMIGSPCGVTRLARLDGFKSAAAMFDWFEKTHGLPFEGLLIRW